MSIDRYKQDQYLPEISLIVLSTEAKFQVLLNLATCLLQLLNNQLYQVSSVSF